MPTSWHPEAVRAQTVAARSYAVRLRDFTTTTATTSATPRPARSTAGSTAETADGQRGRQGHKGAIVTYRGAVALTQFASSNGGHSAQGDHPYLAPKPDPYDGVVRSQAWTRTVTTSSIAAGWSVGTVRELQITERDGAGAWGGRVESIKIIGSSRTITITGYAFYRAYNLRSRLYTFGGSSAALAPAPQPVPPGPTIRPGAKYATFPRSYHSGSKVDLTLVRPNGQPQRSPAANGKLRTPVIIGNGFSGYTHVVNAGDWNVTATRT